MSVKRLYSRHLGGCCAFLGVDGGRPVKRPLAGVLFDDCRVMLCETDSDDICQATWNGRERCARSQCRLGS